MSTQDNSCILPAHDLSLNGNLPEKMLGWNFKLIRQTPLYKSRRGRKGLSALSWVWSFLKAKDADSQGCHCSPAASLPYSHMCKLELSTLSQLYTSPWQGLIRLWSQMEVAFDPMSSIHKEPMTFNSAARVWESSAHCSGSQWSRCTSLPSGFLCNVKSADQLILLWVLWAVSVKSVLPSQITFCCSYLVSYSVQFSAIQYSVNV